METSDPAVLTPIVAGEVLPWVKQWHSGPDEVLGVDLGDDLDGQIDAGCAEIRVPRKDLAGWRPPPPARGRRPPLTVVGVVRFACGEIQPERRRSSAAIRPTATPPAAIPAPSTTRFCCRSRCLICEYGTVVNDTSS